MHIWVLCLVPFGALKNNKTAAQRWRPGVPLGKPSQLNPSIYASRKISTSYFVAMRGAWLMKCVRARQSHAHTQINSHTYTYGHRKMTAMFSMRVKYQHTCGGGAEDGCRMRHVLCQLGLRGRVQDAGHIRCLTITLSTLNKHSISVAYNR